MDFFKLPLSITSKLKSLNEKVASFNPVFTPLEKLRDTTVVKKLSETMKAKNPTEAGMVQIGNAQVDPVFTGALEKVGTKVAKQAIAEAPKVFKGFPDLTTKVLDRLKGKDFTSKQEIMDFTNMPELKQAERDLIRRVANGYSGMKVNVQDFANKVKTELLPLSPSHLKDGRYENISLPEELRGPVADYTERIYSSPIKTSAGDVHYSGDYPNANYFAHTRIEDLPHSSYKKGEFAPAPGTKGETRRVIEIQSDLFQKGRLEGEAFNDSAASLLPPAERQRVSFLEKRLMDIEHATNRAAYADEIPEMVKERDALMKKANSLRETAITSRAQETSKLEPYRNTWHERVIREEVKQAAKDGKTKLQFPTGETAMKIEGLGSRENWYTERNAGHVQTLGNPLAETDLQVGRTIRQQGTGGDAWIITDVLGDGKFKAVPKSYVDEISGKTGFEAYKPDVLKEAMANRAETFDISGKVDTNNPIYKFYEKEVGKYLRNKYDAKLITDPQGVKWWELNIDPKFKNAPVEAYGVAAGLEQDENGNIRFNPEKAMLGVLGMGSIKYAKSPDLIKSEGDNIVKQGIELLDMLAKRYDSSGFGLLAEKFSKLAQDNKIMTLKQKSSLTKKISEIVESYPESFNKTKRDLFISEPLYGDPRKRLDKYKKKK